MGTFLGRPVASPENPGNHGNQKPWEPPIFPQKPWELVPLITNAGGVFLGEFSSEVMGDYVAGPSHALPTHGTARFASYLGADQFVKRIPIVALSKDDAVRLAPTAATIAYAEGFTGHAKAAELRSRRDS